VHGMRPRLVLIGAGHVNRAIAQSAALLGFDIAVADIYRESLNPELFAPINTRRGRIPWTLINTDIAP
ncbi:hypothetical protein ACUOFC_69170, partial [Escherichia sp. TWPC-MK]